MGSHATGIKTAPTTRFGLVLAALVGVALLAGGATAVAAQSPPSGAVFSDISRLPLDCAASAESSSKRTARS